MARRGPRDRDHQPDRLPGWTWLLVVLGGVMSYVGVAVLLHGHRLHADLASVEADAASWFAASPENWAPYLLMLIPAVIGGVWTREALQTIAAGRRRGDPPLRILRDLGLYLLSNLALLIAALLSDSTPRH